MRITIKRIITLCIISCLLTSDMYVLTGCVGHRSSKVPMLDDPVATTHAFRPVTRRYIGDVETLMGIVVPAQYKCRTEQPVILAHLDVSIGDYVKEGQVIAKADTSELEARITEAESRISSLKTQKIYQKKISDKQQEKLGYQKKQYMLNDIADELTDTEKNIINTDTDRGIDKENLRYNVSVIDNNIKEEEKNIKVLNDEIAKLTFTAPHDGFVSYVVPLSEGGCVNANECIAVISDMNELYIETPDVSAEDYGFGKYSDKWTFINGKKAAINECAFSQDELSASNEKGAAMRFKVDAEGLSPGMTIPLCFVRDDYRKCLSIGNDSLYKEDDNVYVYVRGENDKLIKRQITLGETDAFYSEVCDGLSEGEDVFYENNALVPVSFSKATADISDYNEIFSSEYYEQATSQYDMYIAPCNGVVEESVKEGTDIHAGDKLLSLSSVTGRAESYEAKLAVKNLDTQHKQSEADYDRQRQVMYNEMEMIHKAIAGDVTDTERKTTESVTTENNLLQSMDATKTQSTHEDEILDGTEKTNMENDNTESNNTDNIDTESSNADSDGLDGKKNAADKSEKNAQKRKASAIENYNMKIKECEWSINELRHEYENAEYKRQREILVKRCNEICGEGNESGIKNITALNDGIMNQVFCDVSGAVVKGNVVAVIGQKSDEVILVKMSSTGDTAARKTVAGIGQQVSIDIEEQSYSGVCVGVKNGGSSGQFFVRLDGVKLSDFEGDRDNAKISDFGGGSDNTDENDEQSEVSGDDKRHITISFYGTYMKSVITIPKKAVYTETDSLTQKKNSYVWKLINDVPVKEYVKVCEAVSNGDKAVIISGVDAGDVVIYE